LKKLKDYSQNILDIDISKIEGKLKVNKEGRSQRLLSEHKTKILKITPKLSDYDYFYHP
jgi:hypothetical protein